MTAARTLAAAIVTLTITGCATTTVTTAFDEARDSARSLTGVEAPPLRSYQDERQASEAAAAVDRMLGAPLTSDDAVRIAFLTSAQLQLVLHQTAASMAAAIQSGRLANPTFALERLVKGEIVEIDRLVAIQVIDLLTWPTRREMADARLAEEKVRAASHLVDAVANVRRAWVEAVSAQQTLAYNRDVVIAAEASAELAQRMQRVGNFSKLQRAREQAFYADAVVQLARAQHAHLAAREALARLLGLRADQAARLRLPDRLPDLPAQPRGDAEVAQAAMDQRLDVQASQKALQTVALLSGVTNVRSVVNRLEVGGRWISETNEPGKRGFEVEVPVPIFDPGDAIRAEMRSTYEAAVFRTRQVIIDAQSQVRQSYDAYRTSFDIARHYRDEIVPLRKDIAEENLYRYNGMLIGVFELLADAREQVGSVMAAIETQREFWLADIALNNALIGRPESLPRTLTPVFRGAAGGSDPH